MKNDNGNNYSWDNDPVDHDGTDGFENYDKDEI